MEQSKRDPWTVSAARLRQDKPLYICVSGNSGAGKSTFVKLLAEHLIAKEAATIAIDEKSLHHPFISKLFFETASFGFEIQLNFMLQRAMLVRHWLSDGYNVVMERSHLEDLVFIRHLLKMGYVNPREHDAYLELWHCIDQRLPLPDLMIFLDVTPEISLARLHEDELTGRRPPEFPNEDTKHEWIHSWHRLYLDRIEELKRDLSNKLHLIVANETSNPKDICRLALSKLGL